MSDTLDRLGLFDGGYAHSCEYPAPHSDVAPAHDHETAGIPASSEDCMQFFDWARFESDQATDVTTQSDVPFDWERYLSDQATDVTTQSDVPSEGKPAAKSPDLTPATPAANHDDDCPMPDAPSQEPPQSHVWPDISGPHPRRDLAFDVEASPSPPPSPAMHLDSQPQAVSPTSQKKTRVVKDPEETSQVRDARACYHCKMSKTACTAEEVCKKCRLKPLSSLVCIRKPLQEMVPSTFFRWSWNDPNFLIPSRERFTDGLPHQRIFVSVSEVIDSPTLEVEVALLKGQGPPGSARVAIAPGKLPSEDLVCRWMREQIEADTRADFEAEMDKLLLELVRRQEEALLGQHAGTLHQMAQIPEGLLSNLLKMRCMWKVWSCKRLFARQQPGSPAFPFDLRLASVQDFLRFSSARRISELEREVLPELDRYLSRKDKSPAAGPGVDVMRWLLSWQMILIYRQSLGWVLHQQQQTDAAPTPIAVLPMNGERHTRHTFRETTRQLFEAIIVLYSGLFHKKTTVERTRDAGPQVFGDDSLFRAYQRAWRTLPEFYQQVLRQMSPTDELFIEYVVRKESGILAKARPTRK